MLVKRAKLVEKVDADVSSLPVPEEPSVDSPSYSSSSQAPKSTPEKMKTQPKETFSAKEKSPKSSSKSAKDKGKFVAQPVKSGKVSIFVSKEVELHFKDV